MRVHCLHRINGACMRHASAKSGELSGIVSAVFAQVRSGTILDEQIFRSVFNNASLQ